MNILIIIATGIVSVLAWRDQNLFYKLALWPNRMHTSKDYARFLTCGFVHADTMHLIFNMFTLFFIGDFVEDIYTAIAGGYQYLIMYLSAIVVSSIPSFIKHKNNPNYISIGASGGVAAVMFSMIYFAPWQKLYVFFIPMYSIIFAVLYLGYTIYMDRKGQQYINHSAHLYGALYGLLFSFLIDPTKGQYFLQQILNPPF